MWELVGGGNLGYKGRSRARGRVRARGGDRGKRGKVNRGK